MTIFSIVPIPVVLFACFKRFLEFVDKILAAKQNDPKADTNELEAKIDQMVYELYGLTDEEIAIVKGGAHNA